MKIEYIVLSNYLKRNQESKKEKKQKEKRNLKYYLEHLGLINIILFAIVLISAICSLCFGFASKSLIKMMVFIGVELIGTLLLSATTRYRNIKISNSTIEKKQEEYKQIKGWLYGIGYKTRESIDRLLSRCISETEWADKEFEHFKSIIHNLIKAFVLPVIAALFSWIFDTGEVFVEKITLIIEISVFAFIIYITLIGALYAIRPLMYKNKMICRKWLMIFRVC